MALADEDRSFAFRALDEPDFRWYSEMIRLIPEQARVNPGPRSFAAYRSKYRALAALESVRAVDPAGAVAGDVLSHENELREAEEAFEKGHIPAAMFEYRCNALYQQSRKLRSGVLAARRACLVKLSGVELLKSTQARNTLTQDLPTSQARDEAVTLGILSILLSLILPAFSFLQFAFLIFVAAILIFIYKSRVETLVDRRTQAEALVAEVDRTVGWLRSKISEIEEQLKGEPSSPRLIEVEKAYEGWRPPS